VPEPLFLPPVVIYGGFASGFALGEAGGRTAENCHNVGSAPHSSMSIYAAIDIGSNSIRLAVADTESGRFYKLLAAERQVTRIGEGVFTSGRVAEKAIEETCAVLARFAATCQKWQPVAIRAVATSAIRDASNQAEFLARASKAAGVQIQVISGREEARLIHLGVLARWPKPDPEMLVLDIGGGSAEVIWSQSGEIRYSKSLPLGAVRLTESFLQHDPPAEEELAELHEYIQQQFAGTLRRLGRCAKARAIGTSATAAAAVCAVNRIRSSDREEAAGRRARYREIQALYRRLIRMDCRDRQRIPGIGPRRAEIIIPGVAVLQSFVEHFTGGAIYYSPAGLRDGLIADLAARRVTSEAASLDRQQRRTVMEMARRYGVSLPHARQVATLARSLFLNLASAHRLPLSYARLLEAAAYLHDVGHYVSSIRHHKHSYYLVANSDMPGFTDREQLIVANICRYHRKALPSDEHDHFRTLKPDERRAVALLVPLLRVADGLDRGHRQLVTSVEAEAQEGRICVFVKWRPGIELDLWAARRAAPSFGQVYRSELVISSQR
jgi:exopolyphosphatase/guanosine-5'-triphosphate,3'-diphosphate pyrophosphatase